MPLDEFKQDLEEQVNVVQKGDVVVITDDNDKAVAVAVKPEIYDEMMHYYMKCT